MSAFCPASFSISVLFSGFGAPPATLVFLSHDYILIGSSCCFALPHLFTSLLMQRLLATFHFLHICNWCWHCCCRLVNTHACKRNGRAVRIYCCGQLSCVYRELIGLIMHNYMLKWVDDVEWKLRSNTWVENYLNQFSRKVEKKSDKAACLP